LLEKKCSGIVEILSNKNSICLSKNYIKIAEYNYDIKMIWVNKIEMYNIKIFKKIYNELS